jgi:hypothetical protein
LNLNNQSDFSRRGLEDGTSALKSWTGLFNIAREVHETFYRFVKQLSRLETCIADVKLFFEPLWRQGRLPGELKVLKDSLEGKGWIDGVRKRLEHVFATADAQQAAKAIQGAQKVLGIKTKFPEVEQIAQSTESDHRRTLKDVGQSAMETGKRLSEWKKQEIEILENLPKAENLLSWRKENIESRSDLKTFYELAMISAGETDQEVDRVSHFYQTIIRFAPLILELPAESCTFEKFLSACKDVFRSLVRNPDLASNLLEANRNLEWIKACKDQQGSVEQSSLNTVAKINASGIFEIGLMPDSSRTLENCIRLRFQRVANQTEELQDMSLEKLKELNSKLMLITAGTEGKKDVERFSRILMLVELVAKHYMKLLSAGCHFFSQWSLKASCHIKTYLPIT